MKKLLPILLVLLLSACAGTLAPETTAPASSTAPNTSITAPPETDGPGEAVVFRSAAIEKAARKLLESPAGPMTREMLDSVTELFVTMDSIDQIPRVWDEKLPFPAENPVDASELAHFPNLEKLVLVGVDNELDTLPALPKLSALALCWHGNWVSGFAPDISPLTKFKRLKTLEIAGYDVQNIEALAVLPLESISFYYTNVTDLSPFAGFLELKVLKLYNF